MRSGNAPPIWGGITPMQDSSNTAGSPETIPQGDALELSVAGRLEARTWCF
jgi:hypothetical protein